MYDAVTDLSCSEALQLADVYPDAQIILTERDFDAWFPSFDAEVLRPLFGPWVDLFLKGVGTIIGNRAGLNLNTEENRCTHTLYSVFSPHLVTSWTQPSP